MGNKHEPTEVDAEIEVVTAKLQDLWRRQRELRREAKQRLPQRMQGTTLRKVVVERFRAGEDTDAIARSLKFNPQTVRLHIRDYANEVAYEKIPLTDGDRDWDSELELNRQRHTMVRNLIKTRFADLPAQD